MNFMSRKNKLRRQKSLQTQFPIQPVKANDLATVAQLLSDTQAMLSQRQHAQQHATPSRTVEVVPANVVKGLAAIATDAWLANKKMVNPTTGEPHESMARVYKNIERIMRHLEDMSFKICDHTGKPYDDGQPMKVVTSVPRSDATRKYVLETLKPTVYWNEQIIQHGEIEIAVPPASITS